MTEGPRLSRPARLPPPPVRAGSRRFWLLSALRAHTKVPYKADLHRDTLRALNRPGRPGPWSARRPAGRRRRHRPPAPAPPGPAGCTGAARPWRRFRVCFPAASIRRCERFRSRFTALRKVPLSSLPPPRQVHRGRVLRSRSPASRRRAPAPPRRPAGTGLIRVFRSACYICA